MTSLARLARHEGADAITGKLALRLLVKPLHLWDPSFERTLGFGRFPVSAGSDLDRFIARAVVKRFRERLRQVREWNGIVDREMFHEGALQTSVIGLHRFRAATPGGNRAFRERFRGVRHNQVGFADELGSQPVASRTGAEVAIEGKMLWGQFA